MTLAPHFPTIMSATAVRSGHDVGGKYEGTESEIKSLH